ncbi:MAG: hypothetical protein JWM58_3824 [Rhizobium sp.]|nr:hypothetical protein [Rhizobium sp.]
MAEALRHRHDCYPERRSMNHQELIQKISDRCGIEFSIVDEIIRALLTLTADQFKTCDGRPPE